MFSELTFIFSSLSLIHGFGPIGNIFKFSSYDEIQETINYIASVNNHISIETIGQSLENRGINVVKIKPVHGQASPKIYIQAGIHAREWIAPASALYLIHMLSFSMWSCKDSYSDPGYCNFEWHIVPLVNPDGYEFSRTPPEKNRDWRKNRNMVNSQSCISSSYGGVAGVDINRNFESFWIPRTDKCDPQYGGETPFSEPETKTVRDYINRIKMDSSLKAAIDVHSYSEVFLIPDKIASPAKKDNLIRIGNEMAKAIKNVTSTADYSTATVRDFYGKDSCNPIAVGGAEGNSMDWFFHGAGVDISYTMEVSPNWCEEGHSAFREHEGAIMYIGQQVFAAAKALADEI